MVLTCDEVSAMGERALRRCPSRLANALREAEKMVGGEELSDDLTSVQNWLRAERALSHGEVF